MNNYESLSNKKAAYSILSSIMSKRCLPLAIFPIPFAISFYFIILLDFREYSHEYPNRAESDDFFSLERKLNGIE